MMSSRILLGPLRSAHEARTRYGWPTQETCLIFGEQGDIPFTEGDSWETLQARFPSGWQPDYLVLWLAYQALPPWVREVPLPIIGLAPDWNLLWHSYRLLIPQFDLVFTDQPGVDHFTQLGWTHVRAVNLFGLGNDFVRFAQEETVVERDIDILFVGNLHPAVQRERLRWLGHLSSLKDRWNIVIRTGVYNKECWKLLRRAKIVFNRSIRGESNLRVFESIAAGCLLFQEAENQEIQQYLKPQIEYVPYTQANLESLLEEYLVEDPRRQTIVQAAQARILEFTFTRFWDQAIKNLEKDQDLLESRRQFRLQQTPSPDWIGEVWQRAGAGGGTISGLLQAAVQAENDPGLWNAAGVMASTPTESINWFTKAFHAPSPSLMAGLNRVETLVQLGQHSTATQVAHQVLNLLNQISLLSEVDRNAVHSVREFDLFRVEWERAGYLHALDFPAESQAKKQLIRWRLHLLLSDLTGELIHYYEAAFARPDLGPTQAALGCALARIDQKVPAIAHLQVTVEADPFDRSAVRALYQLLGDTGDLLAQRQLAQKQYFLHQSTNPFSAAEAWFAQKPFLGTELVSIIILCCNQVEFTRLCLESVFQTTRTPYELILIDNGSTDETPEYFQSIRTRSEPERIQIIRNQTNRGYPGGVNQGLAEAKGEFLVLLNNDTIVTSGWVERLVEWSLIDFPQIGLVGAVSNYTRPPQLVEPGYQHLKDVEGFARKRKQEFAGKAIETQRLTGFCLLLRRDVLDRLGSGLDERFGLGFFDDDDLSLRVRQAGYRLLVGLDVYIHHFGSRTFQGLGVDTDQLLKNNLDQFRDKWGEEAARGYQLPKTSSRTGKQKVSLCMMVKNEEKNISDCLNSVRDLVDEMIVVDTGSGDQTKAIAQSLGAKVFDFPWIDSFSAARNESLKYATSEWVFWMDADDRLNSENRERLRKLFQELKDDNAAYVMKCRCVASSPGDVETVVDHVRLFRNDSRLRWKYRVHEQILPSIRSLQGEVRWSEVEVHHVGYIDRALRKKKLERDMRLLLLEQQEQLDDPFTLFNLGSVYHELGQREQAIQVLSRSLERSHPKDSIVRKLYALIAQCQREIGQTPEALKTIWAGRTHYPDDAEMLFLESLLHRESGELRKAEECLKRLLETQEGEHFASVDAGIRGFKARHNLAVIYMDQRKRFEAEAQWRTALTQEPNFLPARLGLAELYLRYQDWTAVEQVIQDLEALGTSGVVEAIGVRARMKMARNEYASARFHLSEAIQKYPQQLRLRILLSHVLLQEGKDSLAAEQALKEILQLDPDNDEAKHNLEVLLTNRANNSIT
jgi:glycosyltransferase involved in cell wall biosynthesis